MDRNSNVYTFIYASVMVVLVAALLSIASISLKTAQQRNITIEKKQNILAAVNITANAANAEQIFAEKIIDSYILNSKGERIDGDAFGVVVSRERSLPLEQQSLPVFEFRAEDGTKKYIFPLHGAGLWGPIWGYIALESDMNTIYGATFDHSGETPGLGAEISGRPFQNQFQGRTIFDENGDFVSILVAKAGETGDPQHRVDGISGGTITSRGVQNMLRADLSAYMAFFKQKKSEGNEQ